MLNKIKYLKNPFLILSRIYEIFEYNYFRIFYTELDFINKQETIFSSIGLDRKIGSKKLLDIKNSFPFLKTKMSSEHEILFSSLSELPNKKFKDILEIGTYDGKNAFLLSELFNDSNIFTIDLPKEDKDFFDTYDRKKTALSFVNLRNSILKKKKNIKYLDLNSIKLIFETKKFDLIWIDGAHGYPTVCIDLINSLNLINDHGLILCDDILKNIKKSDTFYNSIAAFETLNELKKNNIIDFKLFFKRLDTYNNCNPKKRKFVTVINKVNSNEQKNFF